MSEESRDIEVVEASTHNLKAVSCRIPQQKLTVVTGVSGSGKSSLAFDTVYAEGQRRYVETLSTYVRQFLQQMERPPVRDIRNLQPSLAIRQGNPINNARATVATITELDHHFQTLFAGAGTVICYSCGEVVKPWSPTDVVGWLKSEARDERVIVFAEVVPEEDEGTATLLQQLAADGFTRIWLDDDRLVDIESEDALASLDYDRLRVVVDRMKVGDDTARLFEAVESAMTRGANAALIQLYDRKDAQSGARPLRRFESRYRCSSCGAEHHEPVPALLSPDSGWGDCEDCSGYGRRPGIDPLKLIPNVNASLDQGAVTMFTTPRMSRHQRALLAACLEKGVDIDLPWHELSDDDKDFVFYGEPGGYRGVEGVFQELREDRYKTAIAVLLSRYTGYVDCVTCHGSGLGRAARAVRIGGDHIGQVYDRRIEVVLDWIRQLPIRDEVRAALGPLLDEIEDRLGFLCRAGAGYLTLRRHGRTLSDGELHRVMLATSIGRALTDTCYVLDEPTAGLHAQDTERLVGIIEELRDLGNTVIVVEHDTEVMGRAEHLIELGPAGGEAGGELLYEGSLAGLKKAKTPTGRVLRGEGLARPERATLDRGFLTLSGANLHNLKNVSARFPKEAITVVTGVSGSGKSTLVHDVLYASLMRGRGAVDLERDPGQVQIEGDNFSEVVLVSQDAVSNNARSCPMTFTDAYTAVRDIFASTEYAHQHGLTPGHFSFNVPLGRCTRCDGLGIQTVEMHFIADVELTCDVCEGRRFNNEVLGATWRGFSIADVFEMTVDKALEAFASEERVTRRLAPLQEVGLGYIRLGQRVTQLSGGEKQRLKLASYLGGAARRRDDARLFIFDEPTVGLHLQDVQVLLGAIRRLREEGNTIIVVEHNLSFALASDWLVDLGPGAGPTGGKLVWEGPVDQALSCADDEAAASFTLTWLRKEARDRTAG